MQEHSGPSRGRLLTHRGSASDGLPGWWKGDVLERSDGTNANGADPKVDPTLTSAWSFRRKHLAPSAVAVRLRSKPVSSGSVTGARTGIRFRRVVGPDPKILSSSSRRFRDRTSIWPSCLERLHPTGRSPCDASSATRPDDRPMVALSGVLLERSPCAWPKPLAERSRRPRGHLPPSLQGMKTLNFQAVRLVGSMIFVSFR